MSYLLFHFTSRNEYFTSWNTHSKAWNDHFTTWNEKVSCMLTISVCMLTISVDYFSSYWYSRLTELNIIFSYRWLVCLEYVCGMELRFQKKFISGRRRWQGYRNTPVDAQTDRVQPATTTVQHPTYIECTRYYGSAIQYHASYVMLHLAYKFHKQPKKRWGLLKGDSYWRWQMAMADGNGDSLKPRTWNFELGTFDLEWQIQTAPLQRWSFELDMLSWPNKIASRAKQDSYKCRRR